MVRFSKYVILSIFLSKATTNFIAKFCPHTHIYIYIYIYCLQKVEDYYMHN